MIARYRHPRIAEIFSDQNKLSGWQKVELANIKACEDLKIIPIGTHEEIAKIWEDNSIDLEWWQNRDEEIHHDLNAFLDERMRFLPSRLHQYVHKNITSYDTEEPTFHRMLLDSYDIIQELYSKFERSLADLAVKYRYTIMMARTHGQEAELQSFGARALTWLVDFHQAYYEVQVAVENLQYCKLSGAIGKYGSIAPETERYALAILGFKPFYGATQIMPRTMQVPLAQALMNLALVLDKIGGDIRLAARSGRPLMQEPFGKKQKGSSAMAHKKNTIRTEQLEGMARMAKGFCGMIVDGIKTWEERSIEQSSAERIAWPDLFHVLCQSLKVANIVISNLKVYPDNMLEEVYLSRGVYASSEVKEFLKVRLAEFNFGYEDAYRIVQLACFNVFEVEAARLAIRNHVPDSLEDAESQLAAFSRLKAPKIISIESFIPLANLRVSESLEADQATVDEYNRVLKLVFSQQSDFDTWGLLFNPSFLLKNEEVLFKNILGY